jgi:hypothetical protein
MDFRSRLQTLRAGPTTKFQRRILVALRRAQATPPAQPPTLFPLREDCRPAGERNAAERYREPSLFTVLDRNG